MARPKLTYAIGNSSSTTLGSTITGASTSMTIASDTNFNAKSGEGMVVVDEGTSSEEFIYSSSKSGATLSTPVANRGLEGTSVTSHNSGATVKGIITATMWNDVIDSLVNVVSKTDGTIDTTKVVTPTGTQTLTNKTLTSPTITSPTITNTGTITLPTSTDTLVGRATTDTLTNKTLTSPTIVTPTLTAGKHTMVADSDAATITFNMDAGNIHTVTLGGNRTLALSNVDVGQCFIIRLVQDATGSRTVTWWTDINWQDNTAPTLTTTASRTDVFGFLCSSSGNYDGFIIGQGLTD